MEPLDAAVARLTDFARDGELGSRIADLESGLRLIRSREVATQLAADGIDGDLLEAALQFKQIAGQINVIVHAVGILLSLEHVLEPDEVIESLSLGAGNTGRAHDLETDLRIGEFKFIDWKGGAESIRQNSLFVDLFNLASAETDKRRCMYVLGKEIPLRFLNGRRALSSVLSRNAGAEARFRERHGDRFEVVSQYFDSIRDSVEIVDLREVVPVFTGG